MINTILKNDKKIQNTISIDSILGDINLLPKWEKIKEVALQQKAFLLPSGTIQASIFRKFSFKNSVEKYSLKDKKDNILGSIDLRVYKDSVYIINMNIDTVRNFEETASMLLQIAAEKTLFNTTDKLLKINLLFPFAIRNKIKKVLLSEDFISEENQNSYEKEMFGETYTLDVPSSVFWQKRIKQMQILINK